MGAELAEERIYCGTEDSAQPLNMLQTTSKLVLPAGPHKELILRNKELLSFTRSLRRTRNREQTRR